MHLKGTDSLSSEIKKRIQTYNKSVIAILICDKIIWDKSENFFLGRFCSAAEIGYYNLGYNVAQRFVSILPTTFWRVLFPTMSSYFGSGDKEKMRRLSSRQDILLFFSFPVGAAGMILAYQIIHYLYGHEFIGHSVCFNVFAASIFSSLSNPHQLSFMVSRNRLYLQIQFCSGLINTLDLLLIKAYRQWVRRSVSGLSPYWHRLAG